MPDPLGALLSERDDKALCTGVFQVLRTHYGERFDPTRVPPEHATVMLVWHSHIVICNQGFNGYFGVDNAGDPEYAHMRAAYKAVGCEAVSAVVQRVLDAFPDGKPPADPRDRVRAFAKANHAVQGALNRDFSKARSALTAAVAGYIRDHAAAFGEFGDAAAAALPDAPDADADESSDSVTQGLTDLPYWARVAFFARCARHVLPLWDEAWPAAPPDYLPIVEQSIVLAERSAAEARPAGDLKVAATHPARVASAAMATVEGRPTPDHPPDHPERAALIAATAGSALDFVAGVDDTGSYSFAKTLTDLAGLDALLEDIEEDFNRIESLAREGEWTDRTPVPPDVFNPAYKPGKSWWKRW
jgi:hypothetical protein